MSASAVAGDSSVDVDGVVGNLQATVRHVGEVQAEMPTARRRRGRYVVKRLGVVVAVLALALGGAVLVRRAVQNDSPPLVITHWSNSHPMREGLLPEMAERFNADEHETASGRPIEVAVVLVRFGRAGDRPRRPGEGIRPAQRRLRGS